MQLHHTSEESLFHLLINAICVAAIDGTPSTLDDPEFKTLEKLFDENSRMANNQTNMVIIEDGSNNELNSRKILLQEPH